MRPPDVYQQLRQPPARLHVVLQTRGEPGVEQQRRQARPKRLARARVVREPEVAPDDVFEQARRRGVREGLHHRGQHRGHGEEPLGGGADVREPCGVQQNLLDDERRDGFRELRPHLHGAKAQRDDFGGEQKVDDVGVVDFDQRSDDAQRRQPQVLERPRLADGVEEGVEEERDVRLQEERAGVGVGGDALEQGEGVADAVGGVGGEGRRGEERVDGDDFLLVFFY